MVSKVFAPTVATHRAEAEAGAEAEAKAEAGFVGFAGGATGSLISRSTLTSTTLSER